MDILYLLFFSFIFCICIFKNIFIIRSQLRRYTVLTYFKCCIPSDFNFIDPEIVLPIYNEKVKYIWYTILYQIPFMSWIGYFSVAYYCGKNMDVFLSFWKKYKIHMASMCLYCYISYDIGIYRDFNPYTIKRVDIIFYTISLTFLFFYIASRMQNIPSFLIEVSKYSFGIYLLHPFFNYW